jgi:hypothetical protein
LGVVSASYSKLSNKTGVTKLEHTPRYFQLIGLRGWCDTWTVARSIINRAPASSLATGLIRPKPASSSRSALHIKLILPISHVLFLLIFFFPCV